MLDFVGFALTYCDPFWMQDWEFFGREGALGHLRDFTMAFMDAVIEVVRAADLASLEVKILRPSDCEFGYRTSLFRGSPGRHLVLSVTYRLEAGGPATVTYRELQNSLGVRRAPPTLGEVREAVLELRRAKSMVIDGANPNRRSVVAIDRGRSPPRWRPPGPTGSAPASAWRRR